MSVVSKSLAVMSLLTFVSTSGIAQSPSAPSMQGVWVGDMITDAFRGTIELTFNQSPAGWSVLLNVKIGNNVATGPGVPQMVSNDSIRFTSSVGGAETFYSGVRRGDSISGTLEARRDGAVLGRGEWRVSRSTGSPVSASAPASQNSNRAIFDEVWTLVDTRYGNFPAKGIDWNLIRTMYRDDAARARDDGELATTISRILSHLNDNHISMKVGDSTYRPNGGIDRSTFVADSIVARRFTSQVRKANSDQWMYAWLADSIGYLRIDGFQNDSRAAAEIDSILNLFRPSRGLVIDLRKHFGGDDRAANAVINRFATSRIPYMTSLTRSGDRHDQFLAPREFFAEPKGAWQFTKPVIVLTSRRTVSAGENFLLGMRELPQVTVIGDVTSGAFSDVGHFTLGNGWQLNFPFNRFLDRNGFSWEGVGLAPDMRYVATAADISAGRDPLLDLGVKTVKAAASGT